MTNPAIISENNTSGVLPTNSPYSIWPNLPKGVPVSGSETAADDVQQNVGEVTAVETSYALQRHVPTASVKNASGDYTQPTGADADSALAYATQQADGYEVLNFNGTGPHVYNPSTYSYMLAQTTGGDPTKGAAIAGFADYALTVGQESQNIPGYGSLGLSLENYGIGAIKKGVPGASGVSLTAGEQMDFSCGDLTVADVQAGTTTPACSSAGSSSAGSSSAGSSSSATSTTLAAGGAAAAGVAAAGVRKVPLPAGAPKNTYATPVVALLATRAKRISAAAGGAQATVTVPAGALPSGTTLSLASVKNPAPLAAEIPKGHNYVTSFAVSWATATGSAPNAKSPVTITITDRAIVAGDMIYELTSGGLRLLGTASTAGSATLTFNADPAFLIASAAAAATTTTTLAANSTAKSTASTTASSLATTTTLGTGGPSAAASLARSRRPRRRRSRRRPARHRRRPPFPSR